MKLNQYEINFLTESFPLSLSCVRKLFEDDFKMEHRQAIQEAIKMLKRFFDLGYLSFHVWLFYEKDGRHEIILNEPEHGYKLAADEEFWMSLNDENEVWKFRSSEEAVNSKRFWSIGVDLTDKFEQEYCEPNDTKFWKMINQE